MTVSTKKVKVLVVDDSAIVRKILSEELDKDPQIEVLGTAPDPYIARNKILKLEPDVLVLDIEMPRMDGLTFLKKIMQYHPMPVIIVSSLTKKGSDKAIEALSIGAVDVMGKPGGPYSVGEMKAQLIEKVKLAGDVRIKDKLLKAENKLHTPVKVISTRSRSTHKNIIAIGASTGGTEAIKEVIFRLPTNIPGIVIVQHMPAYFTKNFANHLNQQCDLYVKEAEHGDRVEEGKVLIAPGGIHMVLKHSGGYYVELRDGPMIHHQKPAVSLLFKSVAEVAGPEAIGVILTGMGKDGSETMVDMKEAGAYNIAQDEESCVVFGMPAEAIKNNAVHRILSIEKIAGEIVRVVDDHEH